MERLLRCDAASLARLEGAGGEDLVVVFGPPDALPWVDGLLWLGQVPEAPALWLPTTLAPDAPVDLLQAAVLRRTGGAAPVVLAPDLLAPASALPLGRAHLERWRGR